MKALRFLAKLLFGGIALSVALYLVGVAINWRDQPPSPAVVRLKALVSQRPAVADTENAFVYAMGFAVPENADPQQMGVRRKNWLEQLAVDPARLKDDPAPQVTHFGDASSPALSKLKEVCVDAHSMECRDAFEAAGFDPQRTPVEDLLLARYRSLLKRTAWREVVPLDVRAPLAPFGKILDGQRLLFIELSSRAKRGEVQQIHDALRADFRFWRELLATSDNLISKMIALAALRQHFFFGNLALRALPATQQLAAMPDQWSVGFTIEELSMLRTMAGELAFVENTHNQAAAEGEHSSFLDQLRAWVSRPYYQKQEQANFFADHYLEFARKFEVSLDQYPRVAASVEAMQPESTAFSVHNAAGKHLRAHANMADFAGYPLRVGTVEGMRRAALLTVQMRARGLPEAQVSAYLLETPLKDPFRDVPFAWSDAERAVLYTGPEAEGPRKRHPYFY